MISKAKSAIAAIVALLGVAVAIREVAADAPPGRYSVQSPGTVLDTKTGLTWQRVAASPMDWATATAYCKNNTAGLAPAAGWRLPSMTELQTIVDDSTQGPPTDPTIFPVSGTPQGMYWTSSSDVSVSGKVWFVNFDSYGGTDSEVSSTPLFVRCVH